jgi:hypothetical protein
MKIIRMKLNNETQIACFLNQHVAEPSISAQAIPNRTDLSKPIARLVMVLALIIGTNCFSMAAPIGAGCYLDYNQCKRNGVSPPDCYAAWRQCIDRVAIYAIGFDDLLDKYGMNARPVEPGEDIGISAGRYDIATEAYIPGPGTVTGVTFMYVRTDELFGANDMSTVEWTVIGPGSFNPATNNWEITWTVPGDQVPQGYEIAAVMYDPSVPNGEHANGFHAALPPAVGNRMAAGSAISLSNPQGSLQGKVLGYPSSDLGTVPQAYPVPATQQLTIQWTVPADASYAIVVSDLLGREVMQLLPPTPLQTGKVARTFDISALPAGQYLYRVHSAQVSHTGKFLKE